MTRRFRNISTLTFSVLVLACSNTEKHQSIGGKYIDTEKTPYVEEVYIELKPTDSTHGTYSMYPTSAGKYEIVGEKIYLWPDKEKSKGNDLTRIGTIKGEDLYFPLAWGYQELGIHKFAKQTSNSQGNVASQPPVPHPPPPAQPVSPQERLQKEAQELAEAFWKKTIIKCGDTYYWHIKSAGMSTGSGYYEAKGNSSFSVNGTYHPPVELSEAQKLNGIDPQPVEWDGVLRATFPAGREMRVSYGDPSWRDNYLFPLMYIKKVKGHWSIYGLSQYGRLDFVPIKDCAEIPQG